MIDSFYFLFFISFLLLFLSLSLSDIRIIIRVNMAKRAKRESLVLLRWSSVIGDKRIKTVYIYIEETTVFASVQSCESRSRESWFLANFLYLLTYACERELIEKE